MYSGFSWHSQAPSGRIIRPPAVLHERQWGPFVRDPSGIWVLPEGERAVTPLSGVALGSPNYDYPDKQDWSNGLSEALAHIDLGTKNWLAEEAQSVATALDLMETIFTEVGGVDPGVFVGIQEGIKIAELVWGIADRVVGVTTAIENVATTVSNAIADIGESIPILGAAIQIVTGIWGIVQSIQRQEAAQTAEAARRAKVECINDCKARFDAGGEQGTGPGNRHTPSDLFRKIAIQGPAGVVGRAMPYNIGSMYVLLCAPETQGYGLGRDEYDRLRQTWGRSNRYGRFVHDISQGTKRKMWALIKGVMGAIEKPGIAHITGEITSDNGRSIMPTLQEILRREYLNGTWNEGTAKYFGDWYLPGDCNARACYEGNCASWDQHCSPLLKDESRLGHQFVMAITGWGEELERAEYEWRKGAGGRAHAGIQAFLTAEGTRKLLTKASATEEASNRAKVEKAMRRRRIYQGVAGVAGAAAAGYLAWTGMRMFGPKKRGR
jgi:hypothetical protein